MFVDTSAVFAILDREDESHEAAKRILDQLEAEHTTVVSSNYVLLESVALLQHRLGLEAVKDMTDSIVPWLHVHYLNDAQHAAATSLLLASNRRKLSLVDCSSFILMREAGIDHVFAFDEQGFLPVR